jgi:hypothetical protein
MIERLESTKDPDDPKHPNHANDADWYRYRAQRHQGQGDHDEIQDIPANREELSEPIAEKVQSQLDREHAGENVVQYLQNLSFVRKGSINILCIDLCLNSVGQKILYNTKNRSHENKWRYN